MMIWLLGIAVGLLIGFFIGRITAVNSTKNISDFTTVSAAFWISYWQT